MGFTHTLRASTLLPVPRAEAFAFFAEAAFLVGGFLVVVADPFRLFFSAAIRSMTLV